MDMFILIESPEKLPKEITNWDKLFRKKIDESFMKNLKSKTKLKLIGSGKTKAPETQTLKINLIPSVTSTPQNTTIEFDDIKQYLTGFARCIIYKESKLNGKTDRLFVSLNEGQYEKGLIKGYGRIIDLKGECKAGYWDVISVSSTAAKKKKSKVPASSYDVSVPYGKWAWYLKNGRFKVPEGLYIGK